MKTELTKILTIAGMSGLYRFISQARNGVIIESLSDGKRTCVGIRSKVTTLEDIAIYTDEGEVKLKDVFMKMKDALGEDNAPARDSSEKDLVAFFVKVLPDYDRDRFHVSHMRKVALWYNLLKEHASLDFGGDDDAAGEESVTE